MTGHERLRNSTQSARDWANEVRGTLPNDACAACTPPCQNACFLGSPTLIVRAGERTRVRVLVHSAGDAVLRITSNAGDLYVDDAQGLDPVADLDVQSGEYAIYVGRHVESENERADSIDPVRVDVEFVLQTTGDTSATTEHLR